MGVIAKYKFDSSLYANYLPEFNVEFTGFWHPMWILFLTIPIYYMIATPIDNYVHKENISE